jgi:uncharacterized protein (TIGR02145 family)
MRTTERLMLMLVFLMIGPEFAGNPLWGQGVLKSVAEVIDYPVPKGTTVTLQIQQYRGTLQWQRSADGTTWLDWEEKTGTELQYTANEENFIRLAVSSENCTPVYTETLHVIILAGPAVVTTELTGIAATEAYSGGKVTDSGGKEVTEWGVCWSTEENPTVDDTKVIDEEMSPEEFISYINGLTPEMTYYVRAFATTSEGTGYGNQLTFKTEKGTGTFIDARDSKEYKWVFIGQQKWMAENLAWLPAVSPPTTGSETEKLYYVNQYSGTSVEAARATTDYVNYGTIYNWPAAMDGNAGSSEVPSGVRGACPAGWHLPSRGEWMILKSYLANNGYGYGGSGFDIAKSMASTSGWDPSTVPGQVGYEQAGNNSSGFNGLPGGGREVINGGIFVPQHQYAFWWTSSASDAAQSNCTGLFYALDLMRDAPYLKSAGMSVRCIAD